MFILDPIIIILQATVIDFHFFSINHVCLYCFNSTHHIKLHICLSLMVFVYLILFLYNWSHSIAIPSIDVPFQWNSHYKQYGAYLQDQLNFELMKVEFNWFDTMSFSAQSTTQWFQNNNTVMSWSAYFSEPNPTEKLYSCQ